MLVQPGSQRKNSNRRHAIGQHREVRLAGYEIETRGMHQGDTHQVGRVRVENMPPECNEVRSLRQNADELKNDDPQGH